ncbi:MAG: hypothetical protein K6U03_01105 [Firmicutes bacterium]|nr:hypothetical protein [Bacillota bacterium]
MRKLLICVVALIIPLIIAGCVDLTTKDLSGQFEMTLSEEGRAVRIIGSKKFKTAFDIGRLNSLVRLCDYANLLDTTGSFNIGDNTYNFSCNMHQFVVLHTKENHKINLVQEERREFGCSWDELLFSTTNDKWLWGDKIEQGFGIQGYCQQSFIDMSINKKFIIITSYDMCITLKRNPGSSKINWKESIIEGNITVRIGYSQSLVGSQRIGTGLRAILIHAHVYDWNLDGKFTNDDCVNFECNTIYMAPGGVLPLNKAISMNHVDTDCDGMLDTLPDDRKAKYNYVITLMQSPTDPNKFSLLVNKSL